MREYGSEIRLAAEAAGLKYATVYMRMRKGMTLKEAVSCPVGRSLAQKKELEPEAPKKPEVAPVPEERPPCEVPPIPSRERFHGQSSHDRNKPQLLNADASWQVVRNCIKSLEHQVKMFERIIACIKDDPEGRKVYEKAMKTIVEAQV